MVPADPTRPMPTLVEAEIDSPPTRLITTQDRIWLALTGHEPDLLKVHRSEIDLLSTIASRKHAGILQPDLIQLSGQDKRSVPKRTDALAAKGYIVKRTVLITKHRTSLCVLKRFTKSGEGVLLDHPATKEGNERKVIDVIELGKRIIEALKRNEDLSAREIKKALVRLC